MGMALRVKISTRAADQVRKAAQWWAANRPDAPGAIAADFGEAVSLLAEPPGIGAKYAGVRVPEVRRLYLSRVRYFVYFEAIDDELRILAFWHASRGRQPTL
jgi:plasmid stabilization system protein ParE